MEPVLNGHPWGMAKQPLIDRGYYMAARRYEISLRVLKNISRVSTAHS